MLCQKLQPRTWASSRLIAQLSPAHLARHCKAPLFSLLHTSR